MSQPRIGLALAGGGPLGAIYEVGALCALEEAIDGLDFTACDGYIGVSAGGFIAAGLANGMTPRQLCAAFIENSADAPDRFDPAELLQPAWSELGQRLRLLPGLMADAAREVLLEGRSRLGALERLGRVLPTGLLSSERFGEALTRVLTQPGRSNDFRRLRRPLVLVATDLDSGEAVPFGAPGWDDVPISRAVQASAALPGLFPPVQIGGRHYVDGALKKTLHASVLLDRGLDLLICLNPLVPYASDRRSTAREDRSRRARGLARKLGRPAGRALQPHIHRLVDGGLPLVLSQTFRSLIHSRLELGLRGYELSHPQTDIVLVEPDPRDAEFFLANTFSYRQRRHLAEHAYQVTRALLRERAATLGPRFARAGLTLREDLLANREARLLPARGETRLEQALRSLRGSLSTLEARHG
ncbi:patatin-like phospholipase family protein [Pelomonas sp. UHG3]|uniref:Patatin-like phospholipase family protein n=1 Tax=Roseateles hydrophilus TaxID=2975054 RepID=A0ACC6CB56_9BURK|nr:patatin-like phospholipase family protein [Pelomonas sp. UHG3]MCY4745520.1 patatin-like phospholipase family protein [Pelomonas sp. UHG3]